MSDEQPSTVKRKRGFASMSPEKQREIASKGGKASHASGRGHQWDKHAASVAGRKGGEAMRRKHGKT